MKTEIGTSIETAIELLEKGEIVALPTETVYGLAANALNPEAVAKIFDAKDRPHFNPLIVHTKSWDAAMGYCKDVPEIAHQLASCFTPGPLTFLLKKENNIPDLVTAGSDLVAIRIPKHPMALNLLSRLDFPLAAPSANQFGYISPTSAAHVMDSLEGKIAYILDGGNTSIGLESTIIGFGEDNNVVVYRVGGIAIEDIESVIDGKVLWTNNSKEEKPKTAGQLKSHYAPHTALYIGDINTLFQQHLGKQIGLISLSNPYPELQFAQRFLLSPSNNMTEAAQNLFSFLRQIDQLKLDIILVEPLPNEGLGRTINDRLNRAQAIYK
jgi:L-threonylcarbamoyladenylate synthase